MWNGVYDVKEYSFYCVGYGGDMIGYEMFEDCLYFNVVCFVGIDNIVDFFVVVWIYGGGLVEGGVGD